MWNLLYYNSIDALRHLLHSRNKIEKQESEKDDKYKNVSCKITKMADNISYMTNGLKYYCIEVTCTDGIQYGIQAYGEEAEELYKEVHKYFDVAKTEKSKILCLVGIFNLIPLLTILLALLF